MQYSLSAVTKLCSHSICGPRTLKTFFDFFDAPFRSSADQSPRLGISRSITYLGIYLISSSVFKNLPGSLLCQIDRVSNWPGGEVPAMLGRMRKHARYCIGCGSP